MGELTWLAAAVGVAALLVVLRRPLRSILDLVGRTGLGLCFLSLFAPAGQVLGAELGVNLFNALTLGIFGMPGLGLLLLVRWVLR